MTEIRFYHLERQSPEQALPGLLAKAYEGGRRVVLKVPGEEAAESLNAYLWAHPPDSFLPHGSGKDSHAADQPIWITNGEDNPNNAEILILVQGANPPSSVLPFSLYCDIFDGRDLAALTAARERWKAYKEAGHELTYWQQGEKGWEKKS
ncbi:MAG: DNA polymerase III subunit chi [Alphaproteobacteria bacterium]|nr:DNA polymerase III subunit chi [Alphaproteobacteria bacterium]